MLTQGLAAAADVVGFPENHANMFQLVANQMDTVILSRSVGQTCKGLIEEHYGLKGFRIDTKSCSWGPMAGFVCTDPRLNKEGEGKAEFNRHMTAEALGGAVHPSFGLDKAALAAALVDWKAGTAPLIISGARLADLRTLGCVTGSTVLANGHITGESRAPGVVLKWRLVPLKEVIENPSEGNKVVKASWEAAKNKPGGVDTYMVVCVNRFVVAGDKPWQEYVGGAKPLFVRCGPSTLEVIQGLTNPGSEKLGFKACVTGDYDLFACWPRTEHFGKAFNRPALKGSNFDSRPMDRGEREGFQVGNISTRINVIKVRLNSVLQSEGGFQGGQCVHHSDEVGNPMVHLQKDLRECLPLIAFCPPRAGDTFGTWSITTDVTSFFQFARRCQNAGYVVQLRRQSWIKAWEAFQKT